MIISPPKREPQTSFCLTNNTFKQVHLQLFDPISEWCGTTASILRMAGRSPRSPSSPRQFPNTGFQILDNGLIVEEEREPLCSTATFYPVKIGEVLHSRYQIVGKLGYGGYSTVWLSRDLM